MEEGEGLLGGPAPAAPSPRTQPLARDAPARAPLAGEAATRPAFAPITAVPEWAHKALAVSVAHAEVIEAQLRLLSYSAPVHKKQASAMAQIVKQTVDSLPHVAKDWVKLEPSNLTEKAAIATLEALGILAVNDEQQHRWNSTQADLVRNLDDFTHRLLQLETDSEETVVSRHRLTRYAVRNARALHNTLLALGAQPALHDFLSTLAPKLRPAVTLAPASGPIPNDFQKASHVQPDTLAVEAQMLDLNELAHQFETWTGQEELATRLSSPRPGEVVVSTASASSFSAAAGAGGASRKQPVSPRRCPSRGDSRMSADVLVSPRVPGEVLMSPRSGTVSPTVTAAWPLSSSATPEPVLSAAPVVRLPQWTLNPVELGQGEGEELLSDEAMLAVHDAALEQFRLKFESELRKQARPSSHTRQTQRSVKSDNKRSRKESTAPLVSSSMGGGLGSTTPADSAPDERSS